MSRMTRREFLKALGITAALPLVEPLAKLALPADAANPELLARLFHSQGGLLGDSVHPILEAGDTWYRLPDGIIEKTLAQPILASDYRPPTSIIPDPALRIGEWAQVVAPSAWLLTQPAPNDCIGDRVGHGSIGRILDILPGASPDEVTWILIDRPEAEPERRKRAWTQAHLWRSLPTMPAALENDRYAVIDLNTLRLSAYQADRLAFSSLITADVQVKPGVRRVVAHLPGTLRELSPFALLLHEHDFRYAISGCTHQNRFGAPREFGSAFVQLPVYAARSLYEFLPDGAEIRVM
ncbi:MAG: hypothetical protein U0670_01300 [Anaerolineae bacterium]